MKSTPRSRAAAAVLAALVLPACHFGEKADTATLGAPGLIELGQNHFNEKDYERARKVYREVLERFPDDERSCAWAQYEIGFCYFYEKEDELAEKEFLVLLARYNEKAPRVLAQDRLNEIRAKKKR